MDNTSLYDFKKGVSQKRRINLSASFFQFSSISNFMESLLKK